MKVWKKLHYSIISPANSEQTALMQVLISAECFLGVMTAIIHFFREFKMVLKMLQANLKGFLLA